MQYSANFGNFSDRERHTTKIVLNTEIFT